MKTGAGLVGRANPTALFIGAVVVISVIAIGVGLVIFATRGDGGDGGGSSAAGSSSSTSTSSSSSSTTTTTVAPGITTTTTPGTATPNTDGGQAGGGADETNRAYSDPEDPVYEPLPLPLGMSATVSSCTWNAANGGELEATGTVSANLDTDDAWFVTVYWLQNERELDDQFEMYEVAPGQTIPWKLTATAPLPPAEPFRCALEVE